MTVPILPPLEADLAVALLPAIVGALQMLGAFALCAVLVWVCWMWTSR